MFNFSSMFGEPKKKKKKPSGSLTIADVLGDVDLEATADSAATLAQHEAEDALRTIQRANPDVKFTDEAIKNRARGLARARSTMSNYQDKIDVCEATIKDTKRLAVDLAERVTNLEALKPLDENCKTLRRCIKKAKTKPGDVGTVLGKKRKQSVSTPPRANTKRLRPAAVPAPNYVVPEDFDSADEACFDSDGDDSGDEAVKISTVMPSPPTSALEQRAKTLGLYST